MYGVCMETCNKSRTIASRRSLEGQYLAISLRLLGGTFFQTSVFHFNFVIFVMQYRVAGCT